MHWPDSFQANRRLRTINLVLQTVLFITLFAGINYLALHFPKRFDLTRNRFFALSAETRSYLDQLQVPVRIVVAFEAGPQDENIAQAHRDVASLASEYAYAGRSTGTPLIAYEELDVYRETRRAQNLGIAGNNVVLFLSGNQRRIVALNDLYVIEDGEKRAFIGERAFTAAILDVTSATKQKLYFLTGHGEMEPGSVAADRGLSQLRDELRARNFDLDLLDLAKTRRIPDDAALLLAIGPRAPYLPEEQDKLRDYLANKSGRLVLALEPTQNPDTGLAQLLQDWGIRAEDVVVVDAEEANRSEGGDFIFRSFAPHPITKILHDNQYPVMSARTRVVQRDSNRAPDPTLLVTPLVGAAPSAFGERTWRDAENASLDRGIDLEGTPNAPLTIAAVSQRVSATNLPFSVDGGRLIVFGMSDIFGNNRLLNVGNLPLIRNAINWAAERDAQLNIPPRPVSKFQLALSQTELGKLRLGLLLIVPGAVALLGLFVYWSRRS